MMKRILTLVCTVSLFSYVANAQSACSKFYPSEAGASRTLTLYDAADVEQGKVIYTVKEVVGNDMIYTVSMSGGGHSLPPREMKMSCSEDGVSIDFTSMGGAMVSAMGPDSGTITGTDIYLPNDLSLDTELDDAEMVISSSMDIDGTTYNSSMTMRMFDREVVAVEDVTTPLDNFPDCYKLVYYTEMSRTMPGMMGVAATTTSSLFKSKTEQWMKEGVGVVKMKEYMETSPGNWVLQSWGELTDKN